MDPEVVLEQVLEEAGMTFVEAYVNLMVPRNHYGLSCGCQVEGVSMNWVEVSEKMRENLVMHGYQ